MKRQARTRIREGVVVAEGPEVLPHALVVEALRHAAEVLVRDLPRLGHEAELVRPVVEPVEALRLLPRGVGICQEGPLELPNSRVPEASPLIST